MSGVSLLGGCMLETMFMNIVSDISTVISRVTFSPESGGKLNPRTAMLRIFNIIGNKLILSCESNSINSRLWSIINLLNM